MRRLSLVAALAGVISAPAAARDFDVPAGSLANAIATIARDNAASIGTTNPSLLARRVKRLRMSGSLEAVLRRILGSDAQLRRIDAHTWLIVAPIVAPKVEKKRTIPPAAERDIVVTASKSMARLATYPTSVSVLDGSDLGAGAGHKGMDAIADRLPLLSSTHIGPGQDKLFLRGIADSSIGSRPATVAQYLGDLRLTYSAPDPDLLPYDLRSIEVLAGPQGTLYGSGALGGLIRFEPVPPDPAAASGRAWSGLSATAHGAGGNDLGAVLNLPLIAGQAAIRGVAYRVSQGGYIDDLGLGRRDTNHVTISGGRLAVRLHLGDWTADIGGVIQSIHSDDAQYAERNVGPLARRSTAAQPSSDAIAVASAALMRDWGSLHLQSTSGWVRQWIEQTEDATLPAMHARLYEQHDKVRLLSNDTHIARYVENGVGWLAGISLVSSHKTQHALLGAAPHPAMLSDVINDDLEINAYGELTWHPRATVLVSAGLRYAHTSLQGDAHGRDPFYFSHKQGLAISRGEDRLLPSLAGSVRVTDRLTLYARFEEGFRPGGAAAGTVTYRFDGDRLDTISTGWRYRSPDGALVLNGGLAHSYWHNIQGDILTFGIPGTANIGNARILSLDGDGRWQITPRLRLDAALLLTSSHVQLNDGLGPDTASVLPDIPDVAARFGLTYAMPLATGDRLTLRASERYVGRSWLGHGQALDLVQGNYALVDTAVRLEHGRFGLSLSADNLLDHKGNSFAYGTPFTVALGQQMTPPRPRTIRLGFEASF